MREDHAVKVTHAEVVKYRFHLSGKLLIVDFQFVSVSHFQAESIQFKRIRMFYVGIKCTFIGTHCLSNCEFFALDIILCFLPFNV